jgi:glycosyltransferase involved in cell wall biosynthesis
MVERYREHRPTQCLSVQFGLGEHMPDPATQGQDLVWIGRVDGDKAPHLAAMASAHLGKRLRIIGPINKTYFNQHRAILTAPHVEFVGELAGSSKLTALSSARTLVYTCSRDYVEAGAAVFGEALRCGTPVAAAVWRSGTCAQSALCHETGTLAEFRRDDSDHDVATTLADAIGAAANLDHRRVQKIGLDRFNPARHFAALSYNPCP